MNRFNNKPIIYTDKNGNPTYESSVYPIKGELKTASVVFAANGDLPITDIIKHVYPLYDNMDVDKQNVCLIALAKLVETLRKQLNPVSPSLACMETTDNIEDAEVIRPTREFIILRGIPCAGKSTYSAEWLNADKDNRVRVSHDGIRMTFGWNFGEHQEEIRTLSEKYIRSFIKEGKDIIIDNSNIYDDYITTYKLMIEENNMNPLSKYVYNLKIIQFKTDVNLALQRNKIRKFPPIKDEDIVYANEVLSKSIYKPDVVLNSENYEVG